MSENQRAIDHLFWERMAGNQIVHLNAVEAALLDDPIFVAQLNYYGVVAKVDDSLHGALATIAGGEIELNVGPPRKVGVDASKFASDAAGCCDLVQALVRVHPKKVFIILPGAKADPAFLDLVRAGAVNCRIVVVS
jgi:hypothetical protein